MLTAFLVGDEWSRFAFRDPSRAVIQRNTQRKPTINKQTELSPFLGRKFAKVDKTLSRIYCSCKRAMQAGARCLMSVMNYFRERLASIREKIGIASAPTPEERVRKTLRVSAPEGIQRSSYFVSMPWRYGIPLISAMFLLHWLISQSVFVFAVDIYNGRGHIDFRRFGCGYSIEPIILCKSSRLI